MNEGFRDKNAAHRLFAVTFNNRAWDLLERRGRSAPESEEMIHAAHASFLHWKAVGQPINMIRAYYLLSYVYADAAVGQQATEYYEAARNLAEAESDGVEDWDRAFLLDAGARAYQAAGRSDESAALKEQARSAGEMISDEPEKEIFMTTFGLE